MNPLSVIVADDVPEIQILVANCLRTDGHEVFCASTGNEAATLFRTHKCDLLITDVLMPDGDGIELIRKVVQTKGKVRILAISGGGKTLEPAYCVRLAKAMGAHAVLEKPFNVEQLYAGIQSALAA